MTTVTTAYALVLRGNFLAIAWTWLCPCGCGNGLQWADVWRVDQ